MTSKNSLKTAIAIPVIAAGTGLAALLAGCESSDSEPAEEMIDVHITQGVTNITIEHVDSHDDTTHFTYRIYRVYPQCIDTNLPLSEYEANPSAYLLSASNCVYFSKNHEPFVFSKELVTAHGGL